MQSVINCLTDAMRGEELIAAHRRLLETLQSRRLENVEELVRTTYFEEALHI